MAMAGALLIPSSTFCRSIPRDESSLCTTSSSSSSSSSASICATLLCRRRRAQSASYVTYYQHLSSSSSLLKEFQPLRALCCCPAQLKNRSGVRGVQASLLGVGAPEALVIGVVALLVFGPKGLAEVARTLGKSLRAFQPTIKELQQVSREFKATLEQEIGLDEIRNPTSYDEPFTSAPPSTSERQAPQVAPKEDGASVQPKPYTTEEYVRITEEQAKALVSEEQRKAAEAAAWAGSPPVKPDAETSSEDQALPADKAHVPEQEENKKVDFEGKSSESVSPKL